MKTVWMKCFRCGGKGYERNEVEGSYVCIQCDGVGSFEVDDYDEPAPKIVDHRNNPLSAILADALKQAT